MTTEKKPEKSVLEVSKKSSTATATSNANKISIKDLGLSKSIVTALHKAGLKTAQDVVNKLEYGVKIEGIGEKRKAEIRKQLSRKELLTDMDSEAKIDNESQEMAQSTKTPDKTKEILKITQPESKQIFSNAEQVTAEEDRSLVQNSENLESKAKTIDSASIVSEDNGAEQRVSFVVNLTVNEQGEPRRTEIRHATSGKNAIHPSLDGQWLTNFMQECLKSLLLPKQTQVKPTPAHEEVASKPAVTLTEFSLTISRVKISYEDIHDIATVSLKPNKPFVVQAFFGLSGPDALALVASGLSFQMKVFARELTSVTSNLLATYRASFVENMLEYAPSEEIDGLPPGQYQLLTLIILPPPISKLNYYEGPLVKVSELQSQLLIS